MNFKDLLVVETGTGLAGPLVTRSLVDLGARAIKVESRTRTDLQRERPRPPGMGAGAAADVTQNMSAGKLSVTLNLKTEAGRELFMRLIAQADVYVDTWAPGWLERLGLSHGQMQEANPRLVVMSQSSYGSEGPLSSQRSFAPIMTALAGIESVIGYEDGRFVPQIGTAMGDVIAALISTSLVLAALYERERTGAGALLDISQVEASTALAGIAMAEYGITGEVPTPHGNAHPAYAPHGVYRTAGADRWVALCVWSDEEWRALCSVLGVGQQDQERFAATSERLDHRAEVDRVVAARCLQFDRDALTEELQRRGLSCTPVLDCEETDASPVFRAGGLDAFVEADDGSTLAITRFPWWYDHLEMAVRGPGQPLGFATDEVLEGILGCSKTEIEAWRLEEALT